MKTKQHKTNTKAITLNALILLCLTTTAAFGQNASSSDTAHARSNFTFTAKPYEKTKNYMIYEFGVKTQISGPRNRNRDAIRMLTVDLGMMHNLSEKTAIGASLYGSTGDRATTLGIKPRIRRWLDKSRGVDLSAGLLFYGGDGSGPYSGDYAWPGFISSVSVDMFRWLSVDLSLETLRIRDFESYSWNGSSRIIKGGSVTSLYLGVNGKDYAALAETGALVALLVIALATWDYSGSGWH